MTPEESRVAALLDELVPAPPRALAVDDIAARAGSVERRRAPAVMASGLVVAAVGLAAVIVGLTRSNSAGPAQPGGPSRPPAGTTPITPQAAAQIVLGLLPRGVDVAGEIRTDQTAKRAGALAEGSVLISYRDRRGDGGQLSVDYCVPLSPARTGPCGSAAQLRREWPEATTRTLADRSVVVTRSRQADKQGPLACRYATDGFRVCLLDVGTRPGPLTTAQLAAVVSSTRWSAYVPLSLANRAAALLPSSSRTVGPATSTPLPTPPRTPASPFAAPLPAPAAGHSPDMTFGFAVDSIDGYRFVQTGIGSRAQSGILNDPGRPAGHVDLYYRGAFDEAALDRAHPVAVNGRTGYYATINGVPEALAWEYADGGWAVVEFPNLPADATTTAWLEQLERNVAEATHPAHSAARVPFELDPAAGGDYVTALSLPDNLGGAGGDMGSVELRDGRTGGVWTIIWDQHSLGAADTPATVIGGRRWALDIDTGKLPHVTDNIGIPGRGSVLVGQPFGMLITHQSTPHGRSDSVPADTITKLIEGITFASDPASPTTWFDARTALP